MGSCVIKSISYKDLRFFSPGAIFSVIIILEQDIGIQNPVVISEVPG